MKSFVVYPEIEQETSMLTDSQMGQLFRAMLQFNRDCEPEIADPFVALAFGFIRESMARDKAKYQEIITKRQEAGRKGGRPRKQTATESGKYTPAYSGDFLAEKANGFSEKHTVPVPETVPVTVPETVPVPVSVPVVDCRDEQTADCDRDRCERDFQDVLNYATKKVGYSFTNKQKKQLKRWCAIFPFDVVIMAFDRSMMYNARSVSYVYQILDEWEKMGLKDYEQVSAYVSEREGGESA